MYNIGIDGLPASGKDTITKSLFHVLNHGTPQIWKVIDSSAMYRSISLYLDTFSGSLGIIRLSSLGLDNPTASLSEDDYLGLAGVISRLSIDQVFRERMTILDRDASIDYSYAQLKTQNVDNLAGILGRIGQIRPYIVELERKEANKGYCIVPGRDSYPVVLSGLEPEPIGLYIYASLDVRARRRLEERGIKGGEEYLKIRQAMEKRDLLDTSREGSGMPLSCEIALKMGYIVIDTSEMTELGECLAASSAVIERMGIEIHDLGKLVEDSIRRTTS